VPLSGAVKLALAGTGVGERVLQAYAARSARPGRFPASRPGTLGWWRRGDSTFRGFRCGLDYAFIRAAQGEQSDAERVIRLIEPTRILVLAPGTDAFGESMSLYRAGLKLALFLPLGVAMPLSLRERRQVSPM
jgi:hypothetical protein